MGKKIKNAVIYLLARMLMVFVRMMSFKRSQRFGAWLGRRVFLHARHEREKTIRHLGRAFPEKDANEIENIARSVFEHFGRAAAELVNVRKIGEITSFVEVGLVSRKALDDALARGRGVVFVSSHCGSWELMARTLARLGYPINTIGKKSYDPRFTRLIHRFREAGSVHTIWRGDPGIIDQMVAVVRRGEVMGFLIDQDTKVPGVFVPFFGREAYTPSAAAVLFRKTNAAVVTGFNHRSSRGGYEIILEEYTPCDLPDFDAAVCEDTRRLTARIEDFISRHPAEWVWMHQRWKTRPQDVTKAKEPRLPEMERRNGT
jgi:Kdo2-lipid IVA lauroyltransferase/acyltransferase